MCFWVGKNLVLNSWLFLIQISLHAELYRVSVVEVDTLYNKQQAKITADKTRGCVSQTTTLTTLEERRIHFWNKHN